MKTALLILATGFEETEAVTAIDILRRAGVQITVAGLTELKVTGNHRITLECDSILENEMNKPWDMVILPGGEPGVTNLNANPNVHTLLDRQLQQNKWIAAICAAPRILAKRGNLNGKHATSFPGVQTEMESCHYSTERVVVDSPFITSRAVGTALEFALQLVEILAPEKLEVLKKTLVFTH